MLESILPIVVEKVIEKVVDQSSKITGAIPKIPIVYSSKFVDDAGIKKILELRKQFFGTNIETSDENYSNLMKNDRHTARVINKDGISVGYHSLVPVDLATLGKFAKGELSHNDILSKTLLWENIGAKEPIALYIVGIVVPSNITLRVGRLKDRVAVLGDFSNFLLHLSNLYCIDHLCAYTNPKASASIKELMLSVGLEQNGNCIQNDTKRVIFVSNRASDSFRLIQSKIDSDIKNIKFVVLDDYSIEKQFHGEG
jgi:hypothetical protein